MEKVEEAHALQQRTDAEMGLQFLLRARDCFKASDNQNTVDRVRLAISSARGAIRACEDRVQRADQAEKKGATVTYPDGMTEADDRAFLASTNPLNGYIEHGPTPIGACDGCGAMMYSVCVEIGGKRYHGPCFPEESPLTTAFSGL